MRKPSQPLSQQSPAPAPAGTRVTPTPLVPAHPGDAHGEDLDLEEDVVPNLGGEDQMQDA
jgi:hypothetical protein